MRNWKTTMKQLCERIKINKLRARMILRENKILRSHLKRNKRHEMVMFVYMNAVKFSAFQPSKERAQHRRRPSV